MRVVFGSSGRLGSAFVRQSTERGGAMLMIPWDRAETAESIPDRPCDIVFAGGLTDPKLPEAEIRKANLEFPLEIIERTRSRPGTRYLTLGTILERFPEACSSNPYLKSKLELGRAISSLAAESLNNGRFLHIRLHTLYGGVIQRHMFLGQMATAIEKDTEFKMSAGTQLREYHHVDDIAVALDHILARAWQTSEIDLNSGEAVRLAEVAKAVFESFGKTHLLRIGALPTPAGENIDRVFERSSGFFLPVSRRPIPGIIEWLRRSLRQA